MVLFKMTLCCIEITGVQIYQCFICVFCIPMFYVDFLNRNNINLNGSEFLHQKMPRYPTSWGHF